MCGSGAFYIPFCSVFPGQESLGNAQIGPGSKGTGLAKRSARC